MKVIIAGSRTISDYSTILLAIKAAGYNITEVVCGGAHGVDKLGARYAEEEDIPVKYFYPDWHRYGRGAGYKRNKLMVEYADALIAVWDKVSKGTKLTIDLADELKINSTVYIPKRFR